MPNRDADQPRRRGSIPRFIQAAFAIDLILAVAYGINLLIGNPIEQVAKLIDLDRERSVPTWYASILWFGAAVLAWEFATARIERPRRSAWLVFLLPAGLLAFSIDEVAQIHEALGAALDDLLLEGPRSESVFSVTGVWFLVLGVPFALATVVAFIGLLPELRRSKRGLTKLVIGMAAFLAGAIGLEAVSNLPESGSTIAGLQVLFEESLELFASTLVLWGAYELLVDAVGTPALTSDAAG